MFKLFIKGLLIGIGAIAPSVSGGSLAVSLGIYDKLVNAITNFYSNPKENIKFLIPVGLGGGIGILLFGNSLLYLFKNYRIQTLFAFIGVIITSLPSVFKKPTRGRFKFSYLIIFIFSLFFVSFIDMLSPNQGLEEIRELKIYEGIVSGIILGFGTVIPGISSSIILMALGYYPSILYMVSMINISGLIPMAISTLITVLLTFKLIDFLFKNFFSHTYYGILGFTLGSIISIFPGIKFTKEYIFGYIFFILFFIITNIFNDKFSEE